MKKRNTAVEITYSMSLLWDLQEKRKSEGFETVFMGQLYYKTTKFNYVAMRRKARTH